MLKKIISSIAIFLSVSGIQGCVTMPSDSTADLSLLRNALHENPDGLKLEADRGNGRAQFELSIIYQFGLRGLVKDTSLAAEYRRKSTAMHGYTPITQYIAGLNGAPGRTAIINLPRYDVTAVEARANYTCALALAEGDSSPEAAEKCGGAESFAQLKEDWVAAS